MLLYIIDLVTLLIVCLFLMLFFFFLCFVANSAFSSPKLNQSNKQYYKQSQLKSNALDDSEKENTMTSSLLSRRNVFKSISLLTSSSFIISSATTSVSAIVDDDLTRGGVKLTPFNGLTFNYRNGNVNNGLDASTLDEISIPYVDFLKRLDNDEVQFVEFLAPNGDAAYVTFKAKEGEEKSKPIRIGEGYPIEDPEGWSSPAFVVKVSNGGSISYIIEEVFSFAKNNLFILHL